MKKINWLILLWVLSLNCSKSTMVEPATHACRLKSFSTGVYDFDCYYTPWGAPDKIINRVPSFWNLYFIYDDNHRLTALIDGKANPTDTVFRLYHKYFYENGLVTHDSIYYDGELINGQPINTSPDFLDTGRYEYDQYGRVIRYNQYKYQYPPENSFINNKTILTGDSVLMFVNRDYSRKNAAMEYNEFGYPTRFADYANGLQMGYYQFLLLQIHSATYECD
jgi:hypothetical protein